MDNAAIPVGPYVESKTRAEMAAWEFVKALPDDRRFELATINPTLVVGPMKSKSICSSMDIPRQIILGEMAALPDITLDMVGLHSYPRAHLYTAVHTCIHTLAYTFPPFSFCCPLARYNFSFV